MQWNRHGDIRGEDFRFGSNAFFQARREPPAEASKFFVLEQADGTRHWIVVFAIAARALKCVDPAPTCKTQWFRRLESDLRNKWPAARRAARTAKRLERGEALVTNGQQTCRGQDFIANLARRRKQHRREAIDGVAKYHGGTYLPIREG